MKRIRQKSSRGQATLEMVLILVVLMGTSYILLGLFQDAETNPFYHFISGPWEKIRVTMEDGGGGFDPYAWPRMESVKGD